MNYNPKINLDRFEASFKAIDAHTAGEVCRLGYDHIKYSVKQRQKDQYYC